MSIPGGERSSRDDSTAPIETEELGADVIVEDTLPQSPPTQKPEDDPLPEYFLAGILTTGVAAAFVAVATSFSGIQGTAMGAVFGAMAGSVASQVAKKRLIRIEHRIRITLRHLANLSRGDVAAWVESSPSQLQDLWRRIAWRTLLNATAIGVAGFAVGVTALSLVEAASGQPISAVTTGEPGTGTTFGNLVETAVPPEVREAGVPRPPRPDATSAAAAATDTTTAEPNATVEVVSSPSIPTRTAAAASPIVAQPTEIPETSQTVSPTPEITRTPSPTVTRTPPSSPIPGRSESPVAVPTSAPRTATPTLSPSPFPSASPTATPDVD